MAKVFIKYRLSFKLSKFWFFSKHVEYHLVTVRTSKFDLISDWKTPLHGSSLLFFIGLCTFYNCFSPWFEMNIKPLRILQRKCHRKAMFTSLWTKELLNLYQLCKTNLTTSPILVRFYSNKSALLKTSSRQKG